MLGIRVVLVIILIASTVAARADQEGGGRRIEPAATLQLQHLIDLAAHELGVTIEYAPASVRDTVTVRSPAGLEPHALWTLLNELLIARGHTTIRIGNDQVFSVVTLGEAASLVQPAPLGVDTLRSRPDDAIQPGFAAWAIELEHLDAAAASAIAKPLLSRSGAVSVMDPATIAVAEQMSRLDRVVRAVQIADKPDEGVQLIEVPAAQLGPTALSEAVSALAARIRSASGEALPGEVVPAPTGRAVLIIAPASSIGRWRELISLADQREHTETRTYGVEHYGASSAANLIEAMLGPDDRLDATERRVVVDELTGSLIVTAAPREHDEIAAIMKRLNDRPAEARRIVRVFPIRNRSVQEVASLLSRLMGAGALVEEVNVTGGATTEPTDGQRVRTSPRASTNEGGAADSDRFADDPNVIITPDPSTNRIIAIGEPRMLDELEQLLERLDVRQPQVMLEVTIVGLTEGLSRDLGVELDRIRIDGSTVLRLSSLFGLGATDASSADASSDRGIGFTGTLLNPMDYSILIRALETVSEGRTLSRPRVLVGNNQQATFDSVLQEPFASVNASDTVATTSFGGTQDAGTSITIRPQIAEADHIVLDYSVRLSSFVGESSNANLPPPRQQNSVRSSVTIPDGHAVVVGGIELTATGDAESRVPVVGEMPLIGELFKSRSKSDSHSRFYVFIRADVMRRHGFDGLRAISTEAMRETGVDDGWPTVEPEIMR